MTARQLTVRGMAVPYVTRWSGERIDQLIGYRGSRLSYPDPIPADWAHGVLWMRDSESRGVGEPEWRAVHVARQRRCMTLRLCQVCARPAADPDGRIPWLLPAAEATAEGPDGAVLWTSTPPTCRRCMRVAAVQCPVLRAHGTVACTVADAVPYAVTGDLWDVRTSEPAELGVAVRLDWAGVLPHVLAKQLGVHLLGVHLELAG